MKIIIIFGLFILGLVPLAFVAPLVAGASVLAVFTLYRISLWRRVSEEKLLVEAHRAEARRKANLSYQS